MQAVINNMKQQYADSARHLPASPSADANSGTNSLLAAPCVSPLVAVRPLRISSQVNVTKDVFCCVLFYHSLQNSVFCSHPGRDIEYYKGLITKETWYFSLLSLL